MIKDKIDKFLKIEYKIWQINFLGVKFIKNKKIRDKKYN